MRNEVKHSKIKYDLLGEPIGTATGRLRKSIMFELIWKLDLDKCYRCGQKIKSVEELSIEHKVPWQSADDPKKAFFDLDNIAFSHLHCNTSTGYRHTGVKESTPHGVTRYGKYGCRCDICREAKSKWNKMHP
jgi:hypothetical protein